MKRKKIYNNIFKKKQNFLLRKSCTRLISETGETFFGSQDLSQK